MRGHRTTGMNLGILYERLSGKEGENHRVFHPGNCGMHGGAKKMIDGSYSNVRNPEEGVKMEYGDPVNCLATLPGQYGVGFWSKYKIDQVKFISKLKWKEFNPSVDFSKYLDQKGEKRLPEDTTLFDKCCMVVTVSIQGHPVKFGVLHTVPATGFGVPKTSNIDRNGDQIAFLEWLVTGEKEAPYSVDVLDDEGKRVEPLKKEERVVILGDLNVDFRAQVPGGERLQKFANDPFYTVFPRGVATDGDLQLDYLITRNLRLEAFNIGAKDPNLLSDHKPIWARYSFEVEEEGKVNV